MKLKLIFQFLILAQFLSAQTFTEVRQFTFDVDGVEYSSIATADIDGDLDQDVFITGVSIYNESISKLYANDGNGNFTEIVDTPFDGVVRSSVAFADVDDDMDQDVLITGLSELGYMSKLYINDGKGNFTEMTNTPFEGVGFSSIAFADVDGDMDQDLLITGRKIFSSISKLYINDGKGNYIEMLDTPFERVCYSSIAFTDVDGDKDQDVLITGFADSSRISKLYTNDGSGNFTEMLGTPFEGVDFSSIAFADVDGDMDQDVLITGRIYPSRISKLYTNDGRGNYTEILGTPFEGVDFSSIAFADVDGDMDQDVLITGLNNSIALSSKLYINDGKGNYTESLDTSFENVYRSSIAFADVDGDMDQDVFITGRSGANPSLISKLYTNKGVVVSSNANSEVGFSLDYTPYPNPLKANNLYINYDSAENGIVILQVYNLLGDILIQQKEFVSIGQQTFSLNIDSFVAGSYIIELNDGKRKGFTKFIVQ